MAAVALIESEYKPDLRPIYSSDGVIWDLSCFPYTGPHDPKIQVDIATASHYVNIITRTIRGITHHRHLAPDELGNYLELETQLKIALLTPQQYMTLKVVEDERLKDTFQEITSTWSTLWTKLFFLGSQTKCNTRRV